MLMRDSKAGPFSDHLEYPAKSWRLFVVGVKRGDFTVDGGR